MKRIGKDNKIVGLGQFIVILEGAVLADIQGKISAFKEESILSFYIP